MHTSQTKKLSWLQHLSQTLCCSIPGVSTIWNNLLVSLLAHAAFWCTDLWTGASPSYKRGWWQRDEGHGHPQPAINKLAWTQQVSLASGSTRIGTRAQLTHECNLQMSSRMNLCKDKARGTLTPSTRSHYQTGCG